MVLTRSYTAKNICLAGVKSVTIYDPEPVQLRDLSSQVCPYTANLFILCGRMEPDRFC
jgi:molybdopterin/thiamine biosynthesis adenylyltransferase